MNRSTSTIAFAACAMMAQAQTQGGGISAQMLQEIQKEPIDTHFSVETRKQSITDQKSSGRCWMFSGLNVLRSNYMAQADSVSIEFSQAYLFFWDQLEKSNLIW